MFVLPLQCLHSRFNGPHHYILLFLFPQIELMNKNNRMEQLLVKLAEKQGIHLDPEEAEP